MATKEIVDKQHNYFQTGQTQEVDFRIEQLKKLKTSIKLYENDLYEAFLQDLNKSQYDVILTEVSQVNIELNEMIKNLKKYAKPKKVKLGLTNFGSSGRIIPEPFGVALVVSPWNYPYQLAMIPLIGAMGAGNTVVLKPSSSTPNVAKVIKKILSVFDEKYIAVILGNREETADLFDQKFEFAFFTGGAESGKNLLGKMSKNLTPCVLELGGKSPCIVDFDADIKLSAKRCVWGKFLNAGQTCVAPDYFLVHETIKEQFIEECKREIKEHYYLGELLTQDFMQIVNEKQKAKIEEMIDHTKVVVGGDFDGLILPPTIMDNVTEDDKIMQSEIFAPIMPIISFSALNDELDKLMKKERPLALYYFSTDKEKQNYVMAHTIYGGGCINDTIVHVSDKNLPFGGVGLSGMGYYHGEKTFETFSHKKSVLVNNSKFNLGVKYMPYTRKKLKFIKRLFTK